MCNKQNKFSIDIKITDIVLTPLTCAVLVNEVIKFLVYQKSQIPYPYNWLKSVVTRKRKSLELKDVKASTNLSVERHYKTASLAYDTVEEIMNSIKTEFKDSIRSIREVLIIFGATPYTPKEVFRINFPILHDDHIEANHIKSIPKNQQKILRHIFHSEEWLKAMDNICPTTNMYVMIRKQTHDPSKEENCFMPISNYNIPANSHYITINLDYKNENDYICCSNISVFNDSTSNIDKGSSGQVGTLHNSEEFWYQAKVVLKGFKDCFINKVSATELF